MPQGERYAKAACMTSRKKSRTQSTRTDARLRSPLPSPQRRAETARGGTLPASGFRGKRADCDRYLNCEAVGNLTTAPSQEASCRSRTEFRPLAFSVATSPSRRCVLLCAASIWILTTIVGAVGLTHVWETPVQRLAESICLSIEARLHALSGLTAASQYLSLCRHHMIT
jgi:hypothetical protein